MEKRFDETKQEIRFITNTYMKLVAAEESGRRFSCIDPNVDRTPMGFLKGYLKSVSTRHVWGTIDPKTAISHINHFLEVEKERLECLNSR